MLGDVEDLIIKTLQENLTLAPKKNIVSSSAASTLPRVTVKNLKFKFVNAGIAENIEQQRLPIEQVFNINSSNSCKLSEKPLRFSVTVESPKGVKLNEKTDYVINYENSIVVLLKELTKPKNEVLVRFYSRKNMLTLKATKLRSLFCIEAADKTALGTNNLTEEIVKALLIAEDQFSHRGIQIKPLRGSIKSTDDGYLTELYYLVEFELRVEQETEPVEQIAIKQNSGGS
jgi:hypothetical protein